MRTKMPQRRCETSAGCEMRIWRYFCFIQDRGQSVTDSNFLPDRHLSVTAGFSHKQDEKIIKKQTAIPGF
jgi:hypothetical protein